MNETPRKYQLKVMSELLVQAHIIGVELDEFVGFFASQVQAMLVCPPNLNLFGQKARVWILRGFYPGTHIFFKLVLMDREDGLYAKASPLRVHFQGTRGTTKYDAHMKFNGTKLNEDLTNRMENAFFGANHKLDPILYNKIRMPRCMSPKGLKIFRYKKPRKKKNDK